MSQRMGGSCRDDTAPRSGVRGARPSGRRDSPPCCVLESSHRLGTGGGGWAPSEGASRRAKGPSCQAENSDFSQRLRATQEEPLLESAVAKRSARSGSQRSRLPCLRGHVPVSLALLLSAFLVSENHVASAMQTVNCGIGGGAASEAPSGGGGQNSLLSPALRGGSMYDEMVLEDAPERFEPSSPMSASPLPQGLAPHAKAFDYSWVSTLHPGPFVRVSQSQFFRGVVNIWR